MINLPYHLTDNKGNYIAYVSNNFTIRNKEFKRSFDSKNDALRTLEYLKAIEPEKYKDFIIE